MGLFTFHGAAEERVFPHPMLRGMTVFKYKFPQEQIVRKCMTFPSQFRCGSLKWVRLDLYVVLLQNN